MELDSPGDAGSRRREAMAMDRSRLDGQLEPPPPSRPSQEENEEVKTETPSPSKEVDSGSIVAVVSGSKRKLKCLKTTGEAGEEQETADAGRGGERGKRRR